MPQLMHPSNHWPQGTAPFRVVMERSGSLSIYDTRSVLSWSSNTQGTGVYAMLTLDGRCVAGCDFLQAPCFLEALAGSLTCWLGGLLLTGSLRSGLQAGAERC